MIARQGWTSRLAAMGIIPEAQEQRVGSRLLPHLLEAAQKRGEKAMVLEAFEQNTRAVKLYERGGFRTVRRLYGYTLQNPGGVEDDSLQPCDIYAVGRTIVIHAQEDLPWQMSGMAVARSGAPSLGYQLGRAQAVLTDPSRDTIAIRALIVPPDRQQQGHGRRLLWALWAKYPGKTWVVPAICPEEFDGFFQMLGFARQELNQVQMQKDFSL